MKITNPPESPFLYFLLATITFFFLGFGALYWAVFSSNNLFIAISGGMEIFTFEKGVFYLYGVASGLLTFSIGAVFFRLFKFNKEKVEAVVTPMLFISVALLIILPQTMHFYIDSYTEKNNYQICRDQSHRWLHAVTIVYAKSGRCSKDS